MIKKFEETSSFEVKSAKVRKSIISTSVEDMATALEEVMTSANVQCKRNCPNFRHAYKYDG